jgi:Ca-activated chloride channel family protein
MIHHGGCGEHGAVTENCGIWRHLSARALRALRVLCGAFVAVLLAAPAGAQVQLGQPEVSHFPEVQLFVSVATPDGTPVRGLTEGQFQVREEGRAVAVQEFRDASTGVPLEVCLAIDRSGSMLEEGKMTRALEAARHFAQAMRPGDRAALVSFSGEATLDQRLTGDREALLGAIARLRAAGETALYDGLYWAVEQVMLRRGAVHTAGTAGSRRVVLALTDGNDNRSHAGPQDIVTRARAHGIAIYTIGLGSDTDRPLLAKIAADTGGRFYFAPTASDLDRLYARIAEQLKSEYVLTYRTPRPTADGTRRAVEVTLLSPGAGAPAQGWYQAPGAGSLVVTVTGGAAGAGVASGGPSASAEADPSAPPSGPSVSAALRLLGGALLLGMGLAVLFFVLARRRASSLEEPAAALSGGGGPSVPAVRAMNPRIDLLPLSVRGPVTRVGRAEENDLVLDSPLVSRRHARIEQDGDLFRVIDQGSAHGTFVNEHRVEEAPLQVGDVVRFADRAFRFSGAAEA